MPFGLGASSIGGGSALGSGSLSSSGPNLRVGSGGAVSVPGVVPGMNDVYNQLLGLNIGDYNNMLSGYQQQMGDLRSQLAGVSQGYGNLYQGIVGTMQGAGTQAMDDANKAFHSAQGQITSHMIDSGLGNSTVAAAFQNQAAALNARNTAEIRGNIGQQLSGFASNIGLAQMQNYMQGVGLQNQLAQSYLGDLSGYHFSNTAGNLTGQYSASQAQAPVGGSHGGGGGGGGVTGTNGELGFGGLGATGLGWMSGGGNAVGNAGSYSGGGFYSPYSYSPTGAFAPNQIYSGGMGTPTTGGTESGDLLSGMEGLAGGGGY